MPRSLFPSKNEFWLSDDATSPQDLNSYMRGEKPEIAHAVVAWASQTGKGLLFFNKKGDTTRKQPGHVLALYDATDLKKEYPHDIVFKLNGHEHTLKAANNAERDGWFMSLEKTVEMGKASKEEIRESEGYKAEMEKLSMFLNSSSRHRCITDYMYRQAKCGCRWCYHCPFFQEEPVHTEEEQHRG